jgi:hypothetical protein
MTTACATCHDHKFDPISQKDHYSLEAFFGNTTEMVMDDNRPDAPPIIYVPNEQDRTRWLELKARRELLLQQEMTAQKPRNEAFERWLAARTQNPNQKVDTAPLGAASELLSVYIDGAAHVSKLGVTSQPSLDPGVVFAESKGADRPALQLDGKNTISIGDFNSISGDEPFSISVWVYPAKITRHPGLTGTRRGNAPTVASQMAWPKSGGGRTPAADVDPENYVAPAARGWTLDLDEGVPALRLSGDGGKIMRALALRNSPIREKTWTHLTFTYDGSRKEQGMSLYVNGVAVPIERGGFGVQNSNVVTELKGTLKTNTPLFLGGDGEGGGFFTGSIADFRVFNRVITEDEARLVAAWSNIAPSLRTDANQLLPPQREALQIYYLHNFDAAYRKLSEELEKLNAEYRRIQQRAVTAMVMEENPASKPTAHILVRGRYDQPGEAVEANTPSVLPPMASSLPRNRLGLAEWIVAASNPLTARVAVNRFWQEIFGDGIVRTAGDFGSQGDAPSHQELLDWMAVEFRESGWDMKKMYRLIVTSATYRQSAILTPEKLKKDPENRLLSRGPRFRMDGEMVRDLALSVSGLLVNKLGGPPVRPYQPSGVWEATSMPFSNTKYYKQDSGENLYRRSLYTLWKRSAPPASMDIFDGPTRESCLVHRERTDTPLQALVTMNDPQFVEAARSLAQGAIRASGSKLDSQIDFMTTRILARKLESRERDAATRSYQKFLAYYGEHAGDGKKLLAVGESKADPNLPVPQFAALTMVANQMLSLDEALNK